MSENVKSEVVDDKISDTDDRQERKPTVFKVELFSGETSTPSIQYKKENPSNDDYKGFPSTPFSAVAKNFIDMNSKKVILKSPRRFNVAETSFFRPGNTTIEELYPQMIVRMSKAWNLDFNNKAAINIQKCRRQLWCKNKMEAMKTISKRLKTYTIRSVPDLEDTASLVDSTLLQEECLSRSTLGEVKSQNSSLFLHKLSPVISFTHPLLPKRSSNKTFDCILDNDAPSTDRFFPGQQQKEGNCVSTLCNGSRLSPDVFKMSSSATRSITNKSQMVKSSYSIDPRQHTPTVIRRISFSEPYALHSPKTKVTKASYNMSEMTKSPRQTNQNLVDVDERKYERHKEHTDQVVNKTYSLTRRNTFSEFSDPRPLSMDFDKKLKQSRCQHGFPWDKAKVQFSDTVSSLVNSPGSSRAKRLLSHDYSFSISKKPRSATDALIGTPKQLAHGNHTFSRPSSTLNHSVVSSAHMFHHSPGSQRSFYSGRNGGSPKTYACTCRKRTCQKDNN
ncbi:uncharacterized protein ACNLHF_008361 isoform 2-T2 [Anomaloglossus baeobatrachus]